MENPLTLKIVSLSLILICIIVIVLFIIFVHTMPGKIARKRNNPQAEAIEILSLLGLLIFPLWMAALVWAYVKPFKVPVVMATHPDQPETEEPDTPQDSSTTAMTAAPEPSAHGT
jgi:Na+/H+ antiporter NhaD/arsenite permease-like protein